MNFQDNEGATFNYFHVVIVSIFSISNKDNLVYLKSQYVMRTGSGRFSYYNCAEFVPVSPPGGY